MTARKSDMASLLTDAEALAEIRRDSKYLERAIADPSLSTDGGYCDVTYHQLHKWINDCVRWDVPVPAKLFVRVQTLLADYVKAKGYAPQGGIPKYLRSRRR